MDESTRTELEAAVHRRLVSHLRNRTDVQNIDLMILSGFCRNCLSRWYQEAAAERGLELSQDAAREIIYGEPYSDWKGRHQTEATEAQREALRRVEESAQDSEGEPSAQSVAWEPAPAAARNKAGSR